ncbi:MAG: acetyltransferase [Planctomycetota bacterium]|nr:acetyltransferase [Planctomycetota bacterium]
MTSFTPKPSPLWIYGAGGQGLVTAEAATAAGWRVAGFLDDRAKPDEKILDWPVAMADSVKPGGGDGDAMIIVAMGDNRIRERLQRAAEAAGWRLATIVHPSAWVSPSAVIGPGSYVGAMAAINGLARVGSGVLVNTGAIVEHHNVVGDFAHIGPNAALAGRVTVGPRTLVGVGASVRPFAKVGSDCVVGAGACVVRDVEDGKTVIGVPAR